MTWGTRPREQVVGQQIVTLNVTFFVSLNWSGAHAEWMTFILEGAVHRRTQEEARCHVPSGLALLYVKGGKPAKHRGPQ